MVAAERQVAAQPRVPAQGLAHLLGPLESRVGPQHPCVGPLAEEAIDGIDVGVGVQQQRVPEHDDQRGTRDLQRRDVESEYVGHADHVIVAPLYTAGEPPIAGIDNQTLAARIATAGRRSAEAVDEPVAIAAAIKRVAGPGDIVVCLGAGNSTDWAHALPDWLAGTAQRAGSAA